MGWFDVLKKIGEGVLDFVPGGKLAVAALEGIGAVAEIVGGEKGKKIKDGIEMVSDGLAGIGKEPLPPDMQVEMVRMRNQKEADMSRIALEEKRLVYQDQEGGRDVIKTALMSEDPVVRQARPKMMVKLGNACIVYALSLPVIMLIAGVFKIEAPVMAEIKGALWWTGTFLFGSFTTAFTGYTVARTVDKKTVQGTAVGSFLEHAASLGAKVSGYPALERGQ